MPILKQGAAAIDEIVMGMQLSGVDRIKQLLAGGFHQEAIKEANRLSPDDLNKLAADIGAPMTPNEVEQTDSAVSPPKDTVVQEHELDENPSLGEPNSQPESTPAPAKADINPVEGPANTDSGAEDRAPNQIEEAATPPPSTTEDPKDEHPKTTVPENEVSVATKQGAEDPKEEDPKEETPKGNLAPPFPPKDTDEKKDEPAKEEPEESEEPEKAAALQGYVKGSQDALLAIIRNLQK